MRNKTVNFTVRPVNRSKPLGFQQVNPSFRLVSPSAMAPEAELRVVRDSQVAAARIYDFPVSNLNGGSNYVEDCQEVGKNETEQGNSNSQNEYGSNRRPSQYSSNGLIDSSRMPGKAPATPQTPKGTRLTSPRVPNLFLLMILERSPR